MASPIRMTGLTSGLDTESIVNALTSGYKSKVDKYKQEQTKVSWKQDAWKDINKKVYSLYTSLDSMRFSSNWKLQKATSSNANKATVTSNGKAFTGSQELTIKQLATTASLTGGKLDSSLTGSSSLYDAGYDDTEGTTGKIYVNGESFELNASDTINSVVSKLQAKGLNASFDTSQHRFYVSSKKSGKDGDFTITGDDTGNKMLEKLGLIDSSLSVDSVKAAYAKYDIAGLTDNITLDSTSNVPSLTNGALTLVDSTKSASVQEQIEKNIQNLINKYNEQKEIADNNTTSQVNIRNGITYMQARLDLAQGISDYSTDTFKIDSDNLKSQIGISDDSIWVNGEEYTYDSKAKLYFKAGDTTKNEGLRKDDDGKTYTYMTKSGDAYVVKQDSDQKDLAPVDASKVQNADSKRESSDVFKAIASKMKEKGEITSDPDKLSDDDKATVLAKAKSLMSAQKYIDDYSDDSKDTLKDNKDADLYSKAEIRAMVDDALNEGSTTTTASVTNTLNKAATKNRTNVTGADKALEGYSIVKDLASVTDQSKLEEAKSKLATEIENAWKSQASSISLANDTDKSSHTAQKVVGVNGELTLGGVKYDNLTSNNVTINGLTIQMLGTTTGDEKITITTQTDSQGLYDKVKNFFSTYNDVINELTDNFNAESSKGYDPLTDDQKSEMSDTEVEKWEKKAKAGLLRNDSTLSSIMNTITNTMLGSYSINGKNYSLATFGIMTKGILNAATNRQYEYHIDGDEDDESVASNSDKLMAAINEDPDSVIEFMQKLTNDLYSNLDKKMKRTSMKSAYTIYNDKEMASEYSSYTSLIKQWEDRLSTMEESYYTKFSKMESTLTKLQSSTSSLTNSLS